MTTVKDPYYARYRRQWMMIFSLLGLFLAYRHVTAPERAIVLYRPPPVAPTAPTVSWFLMLRMPAITAQYESGIDTMKLRYAQWLDMLTQSGFHPMKLSEVSDRLAHGQGVPENTVVLVFDPGFRRTERLVAPILAEHRWPAVWLTPETAMQHGHREYVTYHAADQMVDSGWWDVGFVQKDGSIRLKSRDHETIHLGDAHQPAWSLTTGGMALNRGAPGSLMTCLNVVSDWTEVDLLNRLRVERPIERRVFLTQAPVQNLMWGVTTDLESDPVARYDLQVASYKRGLILNWFGTRAILDAAIHAEATHVIGDFTMRPRWDEERGNGIVVLVSRDELFIEELHEFHAQQSIHVPRDGRDSFAVDLRLQGQDMTVQIDGKSPSHVTLRIPPQPQRGLFQLFLVDRFRGTARANDIRMTFEPL